MAIDLIAYTWYRPLSISLVPCQFLFCEPPRKLQAVSAENVYRRPHIHDNLMTLGSGAIFTKGIKLRLSQKSAQAYYKHTDTFGLNFSLILFVTTAPYVVSIFKYLFVNI